MSTPTPIYLDNHATSSTDPRVVQAVCDELHASANAASAHRAGREANERVELARSRVAAVLGAPPSSITFGSGATEANNAALRGLARAYRQRTGRVPHMLCSAIEHSSVLECLRQLAAEGLATTDTIPVAPDGIVRPADVAQLLKPNTAVVAVMGANNEIGTVQPLAAIARLCRSAGVHLHADLCQSFGRVPHRPADFDTAAISAHKLHGPPGVGALYVRPGVVHPGSLLAGGSQEHGRRAGTQNVPGIVGFGVAAALMREAWRPERGPWVAGLAGEGLEVARLRDRLAWRVLEELGGDVRVNGAMDPPVWAPGGPTTGEERVRLANNLNVTIRGICPETLAEALDDEGLYLSSAAACRATGQRSHVLEAIRSPDDGAVCRFGLGRNVTPAQLEEAIGRFLRAVARSRSAGCTLPRRAA